MFRTLPEWLAYLEKLLSGLTAFSLDKVKNVAEQLHVTHFTCPVITVGGTNGKGSCVIFMESILIAAGYKVGAYISPHLIRYNERIRINSKEIDDTSLIDAFVIIEKTCSDLQIQLSYFEFSTLAALLIFKDIKLDVLLLEVGLGGRLDTVNIVESDIAVITTIALDHVEQLGNDRETIGKEKAGIMRTGKPIVCGDSKPPKSIYASANKNKAILYALGQDYKYRINENKKIWEWHYGNMKLNNLPIPHLPLQDAATALMALYLIKNRLYFTDDNVISGLKNAFLPGRFQEINAAFVDAPTVIKHCILDVAHNPESATLLAENLKKTYACKQIAAVASMFKDKDITASLAPLSKLITAGWYIAKLHHPRAATTKQINDILKNLGVSSDNIFCFDSIEQALQAAFLKATTSHHIAIFGSFHTVAEALAKLKLH